MCVHSLTHSSLSSKFGPNVSLTFEQTNYTLESVQSKSSMSSYLLLRLRQRRLSWCVFYDSRLWPFDHTWRQVSIPTVVHLTDEVVIVAIHQRHDHCCPFMTSISKSTVTIFAMTTSLTSKHHHHRHHALSNRQVFNKRRRSQLTIFTMISEWSHYQICE